MKKLMILAAMLLMASSCHKKGDGVVPQTSADNYDVAVLFEVNGCKVYRFHDFRYVYFTDCKGSTHWQDSCGKNCTQNHEVPNEVH